MARVGARRAARVLLRKHHEPIAIRAPARERPPRLPESAHDGVCARHRRSQNRAARCASSSGSIASRHEEYSVAPAGTASIAAVVREQLAERRRHVLVDGPATRASLAESHRRDPRLQAIAETRGLGGHDERRRRDRDCGHRAIWRGLRRFYTPAATPPQTVLGRTRRTSVPCRSGSFVADFRDRS